MLIKKGEPAIEFTLPSKSTGDMKEIHLKDYLGKQNVVLLFFPFAFTGGCTTEICTASDNFTTFENLNAVVLGVSTDSPFTQEAWAQKNNIKIPLLSDYNKEVVKLYGVNYDDFKGFKGVSKRAVVIINTQGKVQYTWVTEDPHQLPNLDEIYNALKA